MFSHFCLITFRSPRQLIQNQLYLPHGWVLQLLVNLHPCVSVEFQCILTSNEFRSEYSPFWLSLWPSQKQDKKLGTKNYFLCSQYYPECWPLQGSLFICHQHSVSPPDFVGWSWWEHSYWWWIRWHRLWLYLTSKQARPITLSLKSDGLMSSCRPARPRVEWEQTWC